MEYRQPDQYYNDRLIGNSYDGNHPNELEECLRLSMEQYIENSIMDQQLKYTELYEKYKKILLKYQRLNRYDSTIQEFTSYIEPIMNEYAMNGNPIGLDHESYQNIMVTINSIRLTEEEKSLMNQLFSKY